MEGFEERRQERALRRAERARAYRQGRVQAVYSTIETVIAFLVLYAAIWLGFFWASI